MNRIDERTVELTDVEVATQATFDAHLDKGHGIPFAASLALKEMIAKGEFPSDAFIAWLSDDTVQRWGRSVRIKPGWSR